MQEPEFEDTSNAGLCVEWLLSQRATDVHRDWIWVNYQQLTVVSGVKVPSGYLTLPWEMAHL
jgi:hypothetical protein